MKKIIAKLFKDSMLGPIGITSIVVIVGLLYLVPHFLLEQSKKDAYKESVRLISYIKTFRSYYAKEVLKKISLHSSLYANYDHRIKENVVPLPATVVHDLGELFTENSSIKVQMYSNFPFPNRKDRVLDSFQKEALVYALKNPTKTFSKEDVLDGKKVFRTAVPDPLSAQSCVNCHNNRADTPKDTWKLGDVRGVIEVSVPIEGSLGSAQTLTYSIVSFIILNFFILSIYYYLYTRRKHNNLENKVVSKDKLLSEYKRAVDLGTIVSKADTNGFITYVNNSFVEISGYSKEELIGKPHSIVRHPSTGKEVFRDMWKKIKNKEVWHGDLKNLTKDRKSYHVNATIVPIINEHNEIVEYLAIRFDTTNLHNAIEKANEAEKTKGRFLANMSHELRTPLNAIIGFSQILLRRDSLNAKDTLYIEKIALSGNNLLALVNSILDFSKIEEGKMEYNPSKINILELFKEVLVMFETSIKDKHISLEMFECDSDASIFADRQLIKQSFINILSNAVKFTQNDGEIKIAYKKENSLHIFGICDNGQGISKGDIKTLFNPFKQGESAQKSAAKGTGLGLAITKRIVNDLHNGNIWVESEIGKGTCFYISLSFYTKQI